ncbi:hypothetical protein [Propionicimonas sp.]|uniref:hypothetical protein n=1 Tax=Propionicimonas sp. TaxID=1955623 RepID=UPI0039E65953
MRWSDFGWQVPRDDGFDRLDVVISFEFAATDYDALLTSLAQRLATGTVTVTASKQLRRAPEQRAVIRL